LSKEEDTEDQRSKLHQLLISTNLTRLRIQLSMRDIMKSLTEIALAQDTLTLARYSDKLEKQKWQTEMVQSSNTFKELKQRLEELKHQFSRAKNDAKRLRQQASKESPLSDQIREEFDKLPNTIPELDELIATTKAKADANYHTDPKVIENYEERKVKIQNLEQELEQEQQKLKTRQEAIEKLKDAWLPPLEQLVSDIDKSFAKNFKELGCAGEVKLEKDPQDFSKYGIQISVKFRDTDQLHLLDSHFQSGGEKVVATMLFLISLQDLTQCPFRLVDEINQGMDPRNERMVFQQVVNSACQPGRPQYFLITPKLLPDLQFTEDVTVLCIFNGPWQIPQKKWPMAQLLEGSGGESANERSDDEE